MGLPPARPEVLRRPPQGWSSLLLFLGVLAIVGISIADARPLFLGPEGHEVDRTGALVIVMLAAGLIGFVLARSSLGVVKAHVLGAAAGAAVLLMVVGAAAQGVGNTIPSSWDELQRRVSELGVVLEGDVQLWLDVETSVPTAATLLVLGAICWTTGQFGAFSIFRYERAGPAVMATGVLLFMNVAMQALGPASQLLPLIPVLAVYSALSMLLLMRLQLTQQGVHWARRHIADTGEVSRLFLRTGTLFVLVAVVGASALTAVAVARPPSLELDDLEGPLQDLGEDLSRWLAFIAVPVEPEAPLSFSDELLVQDRWEPGSGTAFTATVDGPLTGLYWWGAAYDEFDGTSWGRSATTDERLGAGDALPLMRSSSAIGIFVDANITPADSSLSRGTVLGPAEARGVDRAVRVTAIGEQLEGVADITFQDDLSVGESYAVSSFVHDYGSGSLTANYLRTTGTDYPAWTDRYLDVEAAVGPLTRTRALARRLERAGRRDDRDTPYDLALALQTELREFDYVTVINGCADLNTPECLLKNKEGFCQQFASTFVVVMREMDVPARFVQGYLPGHAEGEVITVPQQALHAWPEVFFPDAGWVRFDPTPVDDAEGLGQVITDFPQGDPIRDELRDGGPEPSFPPFDDGPEESFAPLPPEDIDGGPAGTVGGDDPLIGGLAIALGVGLFVLLLVGLGIRRLRRLPSADGALAYRGIVSLATRLGYGPHPSQTEYEYASTLSEAIPTVRDDLYLVADVRVESAYGQRDPHGDRLSALRRAYARIRTALLKLSLRRDR